MNSTDKIDLEICSIYTELRVAMKKRKQIALNKIFNLCMLLGALCAWMAIGFLGDGDRSFGIGLGIVSLLLIVLPAIFTPYCYSFDSEGISLCYLLFSVERYLWKDIHAIEVKDTSTSSRSVLFELFFAYDFCIKGTSVGKRRFFMEGHVRKSFRTKRLFEKYWDGTITGYLFEDTKERIQTRRIKKQKHVKAHLTDEIVPMEREIRAKTREWLEPFVAQAKHYDLEIKTKHLYITKDFEELNSRPQKGYTYTLLAEIARFGETDENRIVVVSVDLLYVRLGKTAYRGVQNVHAKKELDDIFSDVLNEIGKNGIEAYCKDN